MTKLPIQFLLLQLITPLLRELKIGFHKKNTKRISVDTVIKEFKCTHKGHGKAYK